MVRNPFSRPPKRSTASSAFNKGPGPGRPLKNPFERKTTRGVGTQKFPLGTDVELQHEADRIPGKSRKGVVVGSIRRLGGATQLVVQFGQGVEKAFPESRLTDLDQKARDEGVAATARKRSQAAKRGAGTVAAKRKKRSEAKHDFLFS